MGRHGRGAARLSSWRNIPAQLKLHRPLDMAARQSYIPGTFQSSQMTEASPGRAGEAPRRFAMMNAPLMPKATAVWLVENTALSFDQVAEFCKLHPLEVKAIADGDAAQGIKGLDPIQTGQLTRDEIDKGVADPDHKLQLSKPKVGIPEPKPGTKKKGPRYTPVSRRQ